MVQNKSCENKGLGSLSRTPACTNNSSYSVPKRSAGCSCKATERLTDQEVIKLMEGGRFALDIGLPLNRMITLNWSLAGVADPRQATATFIKCATDHLRKMGLKTANIYTIENGLKHGLHTHLLLHVPADAAAEAHFYHRQWLKRCGGTFKKGVIHSRWVGGKCSAMAAAQGRISPNFLASYERVLAYVCKACHWHMRRYLHCHFSPKPSYVCGRRCGISNNIGKNARPPEVCRQQ